MRLYQSCLTMAQLVKHAVHLHLLQGPRILQGLDPILSPVQGYPVAIQSLLHRRKLLINILVPQHQFRDHVFQRSTQCQADATFLVAGGLRTIVTTDAHYIQLQGCGQTLMTKQPML